MTLIHVRPRRWSRDEYHRMIELGLLTESDRVELIEGEVVPLAAHDPMHADAIRRGNTLLMRLFGDTHYVQVQLPLALGASEPEPDFSLVRLEDRPRRRRHPDRADLVIEVANTSLAYDRAEKASLYARYGLLEYWIVNCPERQLEVHSDAFEDPSAPFGFRYRTVRVYREGESLAPAFRPTCPVSVAELLPGPFED